MFRSAWTIEMVIHNIYSRDELAIRGHEVNTAAKDHTTPRLDGQRCAAGPTNIVSAMNGQLANRRVMA